MKVGDRVIYEQHPEKIYTIEKAYNPTVFVIGNDEEFCDMVPESLLTLVKEKKMTPKELVEKLYKGKNQYLCPGLQDLLFDDLPSDGDDCLSLLQMRIDQVKNELKDFENYWIELYQE